MFHTGKIFSGTLLSRISGMGRDLSMAFFFGDHPSVAAFMVAFRFSLLLRRFFGEGFFQFSFIPYFEGVRARNEAEAAFFFRRLIFLMVLFLLSIIVLAEIGMGVFLLFCNFSASNQEIISLTMWLFPGLLFVCLYGMNISYLQCYEVFFIPSLAPAISNLIWIAAIFFLRKWDPAPAMTVLTKWVVVGLLGQWLLTLPLVMKHVFAFWKWRELLAVKIPVEMQDWIKSFILGTLGVGVSQLNSFFDTFLARYVDPKGPVYLWYALRLEQLAFALLGLACVTPLLAKLSRGIKQGDWNISRSLFSRGCEEAITLMTPATLAIFAMGGSLVNLIYGRGLFPIEATSKTSLILAAYGVGLVPMTLILLFSSVCYAQRNFKTPLFISLFSMGINGVLSTILIFGFHLEMVSIAFATSLSAWVNAGLLYQHISKQGWKMKFSSYLPLKIILISVLAWVVTVGVGYGWIRLEAFPRIFMKQLYSFLIEFFLFAVTLLLLAKIFRVSLLFDLLKIFFFRKKSWIPTKLDV